MQARMVIDNGAFREMTADEIQQRISILNINIQESEIDTIANVLEMGNLFIQLHSICNKKEIDTIRKRNRIKPREMETAIQMADIGISAEEIWIEGGIGVFMGTHDARPYICKKCRRFFRKPDHDEMSEEIQMYTEIGRDMILRGK